MKNTKLILLYFFIITIICGSNYASSRNKQKISVKKNHEIYEINFSNSIKFNKECYLVTGIYQPGGTDLEKYKKYKNIYSNFGFNPQKVIYFNNEKAKKNKNISGFFQIKKTLDINSDELVKIKFNLRYVQKNYDNETKKATLASSASHYCNDILFVGDKLEYFIHDKEIKIKYCSSFSGYIYYIIAWDTSIEGLKKRYKIKPNRENWNWKVNKEVIIKN